MQRRQFLSCMSLLALAPFSYRSQANTDLSSDFEAYKHQQQQDFTQFKTSYRNALALYKREILKHWREARVSSHKAYVRYSDQLKVRSLVDFEHQTITIEAQADTPAAAGEKIKQALAQLLALNTERAQREDPVLQRMQGKPAQQAQSVRPDSQVATEKPEGMDKAESADKPASYPIISDLYPDQSVQQILDPAKKEIIKDKHQVTRVTIKMPKDTTERKAQQFMPLAQKYSAKEGVSGPLVMAVMHVESYFNPMARSHVPAFGLMQIVPKSAGLDTTKYLTGKSRYLTAEELYQPETNIENGTAYLHLLYYRYLKQIKDEQSRFYCAIAAYNTGPGNVARAFVGTRSVSAAADKINRMSSEKVYQTLIRQLPYEETRKYLHKVTDRIKQYQ